MDLLKLVNAVWGKHQWYITFREGMNPFACIPEDRGAVGENVCG